jgi:hypothetical protein
MLNFPPYIVSLVCTVSGSEFDFVCRPLVVGVVLESVDYSKIIVGSMTP